MQKYPRKPFSDVTYRFRALPSKPSTTLSASPYYSPSIRPSSDSIKKLREKFTTSMQNTSSSADKNKDDMPKKKKEEQTQDDNNNSSEEPLPLPSVSGDDTENDGKTMLPPNFHITESPPSPNKTSSVIYHATQPYKSQEEEDDDHDDDNVNNKAVEMSDDENSDDIFNPLNPLYISHNTIIPDTPPRMCGLLGTRRDQHTSDQDDSIPLRCSFCVIPEMTILPIHYYRYQSLTSGLPFVHVWCCQREDCIEKRRQDEICNHPNHLDANRSLSAEKPSTTTNALKSNGVVENSIQVNNMLDYAERQVMHAVTMKLTELRNAKKHFLDKRTKLLGVTRRDFTAASMKKKNTKYSNAFTKKSAQILTDINSLLKDSVEGLKSSQNFLL